MRPFRIVTGALAGVALALVLVAAPAGAQTIARGLIVEFKPDGAANPNLQTPQAVHDRLADVARAAGLPAPDDSPRQVGARGHLLRFDAPLQGAALDAAVQRVAADPAVQSVSPDVRMHRLDTTPNDPNFTNNKQWYLRMTSDPAGGLAAINMPQAWDVTTGLYSHVVAVVDSGALFNHQDLSSRFIAGYDFISDVTSGNTGQGRNPDASDPGDWVSAADLRNPTFAGCSVEQSSWHGSFIAGVIGAASNNAIGVTGIDWSARILPVRVAGKCGGWLSDIVDGVRWAGGVSVVGVPDNPTPARIINISLGSDGACDTAYQSAIDDVVARGALVVAAAGNSGTNTLSSPASCVGVLAVGAVRQDGLKTYYSSFGTSIGLMAPGGAAESGFNDGIFSTSNTGPQGPQQDTYVSASGTSFSAPIVAGVASLVLTVNPQLTPAQLIALLQQTARPFPRNTNYPTCAYGRTSACNCTAQTCGAGLLDATAAVQLAAGVSPGSGGTSANDGGSDSSGGGSSSGSSGSGGSSSSGSQGGGGFTGWLWGLGLWGLAAAALLRRRKAGLSRV